MRVDREMESLGLFVHGALAFGHALGLFYNVRRGNKADATIHGLALCYDAWAAYKHYLEAAPKKAYQLEAERMSERVGGCYPNTRYDPEGAAW